MAIRIGLHPAAAPRLHADWNAAQQSATALIKSAQLTAERLVRSPFNWALKIVGDFRRRFSLRSRVRRRQYAMLRAFDDKYEQMVDVMCWAAQSSSITTRDSKYKEICKWMRDHYGSVRPQLQRYWADAHSNEFKDPFDSLLGFECLDDVLIADSSIDDMMLCRRALDEAQRGASLGQSYFLTNYAQAQHCLTA